MKYIKNNLILVIVSLVLIVLGIFCILIRGSDIITIFSVLALIYLFIVGGWMIFSSLRYKEYLSENQNFLNKPLGYIIQGSLLIIAGVLILVFPNFLVRLFIGILLILLPLITLINQDNKKKYLKNNLWKSIVGIIFILAFDVMLDILFIIIGVCFIILAFWIIYLLIINHKDKTYPNLITKYMMEYIIKKNRD